MDREKIKKNIISVLIASAMWLFFCVDMNDVYPNIYKQPDAGTVVTIVTFFQRILALFGEFSILKETVFVAMLVICIKISDTIFKCPILFKFLAGVLSAIYLFAESFRELNSAAFIIADAFVFILSILRWIGLFLILCGVFSFLIIWMESYHNNRDKECKWSFWKICLILFVCWIPILISIYPGGYLLDTQIQLRQYFGYEQLTDAHPPFTTFVVGVCVALGNRIGNSTFGFFLAVLVQFLFILICVSYGLTYIIKKVGSNRFGWVCVLFAGLNSMFSFHASCMGKDSSYAAGLLVMAVFCLEIISPESNGIKAKMRPTVLLSIIGLLTSLIRHNGIYIFILIFFFIAVVFIKHVNSRKEWGIVLAVILSGIATFYIITKLIYPAVGVKENKSFLIYVNMLQHTARFHDLYPDEISDEDIAVISKVLDYSKLPERYNPVTSDGIKPYADLYAPRGTIAEYEKIWLKEIKTHPFILSASIFNMSYGFWAPVAENTVNDFGNWYYASEYPEFDFDIPVIFSAFRNTMESVLALWVRIPIVRFFHNPGIYTWIFLFALCYVIRKKDNLSLIAFIPGFLTVASYFAVPSYFGHSRYCFPLAYAALLYWGICLSVGKKDEENASSKTIN